MTEDGVRVLPALEPGQSYTDSNFLVVETVRNKRGERVTTIDHVKTAADAEAGWSVTALCRGESLTHAEAMEWAQAYAAANSIPIVYERNDTESPEEGAS